MAGDTTLEDLGPFELGPLGHVRLTLMRNRMGEEVVLIRLIPDVGAELQVFNRVEGLFKDGLLITCVPDRRAARGMS